MRLHRGERALCSARGAVEAGVALRSGRLRKEDFKRGIE